MEKYVLLNLLSFDKDKKKFYTAVLYLCDGKSSGDLMTLFLDEPTYQYFKDYIPLYTDITDLVKIRYNSYLKKYQAVICL